MKLSRENKCGLFILLMKFALFGLLALSFFLLMAVNNPQILRISRTAAITGFGFATVLLILMSVYRGFDIQHEQSRHIIYSAIISAVVTDVATYFQLLIMNYNEANRSSLAPEMGDVICLIICMLMQLVWIIFFTCASKYIYYRMTPPRKCCVITSGKASRRHILSKLGAYRKRYLISTVLANDLPDLPERIAEYDQVFLYDIPIEQRVRLVEYCFKIGKPVQYGMELIDVISLGGTHELLDDASFVAVDKQGLTLEQRIVKRALDIAFSALALIVLSPVMLICSAAIWLGDRGPVIFHQPRATLNGRIFEIYKFRTMKVAADSSKSATTDDERITPVGRFLRRYRLDELPQLINILKGDMSVVGPRPEMLSNVRDYTQSMPEFSYRLLVKAGLTGYAQIAGKYNTSPKDKMLMDLMYIENYSLLEDIKLILKTVTVFYKPESTEAFAPPDSEDDENAV